MITRILIALAIAFGLISVPSVVESASIEVTWSEFHADAVEEYVDEFTALFNSYETKWSKNGRLMIRQGDAGSFKFAKKA
jgi:hypothetical protein